jgi:hypothetical protein
MSDRVSERRRAARVARHYRDRDDLTITEIARRLGRAEATVKAYLHDQSDAKNGPAGNGRPSQEVASSGVTARRGITRRRVSTTDVVLRSAGCPAPRVGLGFSCSTGSRNGAARRDSLATTATRRVCRSPRSRVGWDAQKHHQAYLYDPTGDQARAVKARYRGVCRGCGAPPRPGTVRATPTRIANAAIPARLRRDGPGTGSRSDARPASAPRRGAVVLRLVAHPRTPARRRGAQSTQAGEWPAPSTVIELGGGRRGRLRRHLSVRASMPLTYNAGWRLTGCEWKRLRSARRFCHCVRREGATPRARGRLSAGVRRTEAQSPGRRRSRPRRERDCRNQSRSHGEHRAPPDARPVAKRARELRDRRDRSSRQRHQSPTAASRLRRSRRRDDCSVRRRAV